MFEEYGLLCSSFCCVAHSQIPVWKDQLWQAMVAIKRNKYNTVRVHVRARTCALRNLYIQKYIHLYKNNLF